MSRTPPALPSRSCARTAIRRASSGVTFELLTVVFGAMRRMLLLAFVALAAAGAAGVPLFILHDDRPLARVDAVVVLAGDQTRLPAGVELWERGVAPFLVVSDGLDTEWTVANRLCRFRERVLCPRPNPYSTRGEARMIGRLAREHGWDAVVVVTSRYHLRRAELLVERCFRGELGTVGTASPWWLLPRDVALEWLKLARAALERSC